MNKKKTLVIAAVAAIAALAVWLLSGGKKEEKITFDTAAVAPANIMNSAYVVGCITVYCGKTPIRLIDHITYKK